MFSDHEICIHLKFQPRIFVYDAFYKEQSLTLIICLKFHFGRSKGPFLHGILLHSYLGSAEMVPEFAKLGAYFSFSGFLMSLKGQKAKKILKAVSLSVSTFTAYISKG